MILTEETTLTESKLTPNMAYSKLASDAQIERAVKALEANGIHTIVAESGEDAKKKLFDLVSAGAEVFISSSTTLNQLGVPSEVDSSGRYDSVRVKLGKMDRNTQNREMQKLGATPEFIFGSVHAVSETGSVIVASASGSQLGPYASTAAKVVWVAGTQKIVPTLDEGMKRLQEYTYPLEDARALKTYGVNSGINKMLVINKEITPGRITMILVKENLGF
jgi:L-lactate utilization protein LutC